MREYEVGFIVNPVLDDSAFKESLETVKGWITKAGGKVIKEDLWGKKKLAYEIQKQNEGQYVFLTTKMDPTFCAELERNFGLQDSIMRFLIIQAPPEALKSTLSKKKPKKTINEVEEKKDSDKQ